MLILDASYKIVSFVKIMNISLIICVIIIIVIDVIIAKKSCAKKLIPKKNSTILCIFAAK